MSPDIHRQPSGPILSALILAVIAGFVDAHIYLHVAGVFVANMSGNMIRLGIDIGSGDLRSAIGPMIAIVSFALGVLCAVTHHDRMVVQHGTARAERMLAVEAVVLVAVVIAVSRSTLTPGPTVGWIGGLVVASGAAAMGIQAASLRRVGSLAVATTYGTGTLVRLGEAVGLRLRRVPSRSELSRLATASVLAAILAAYILGAATDAAVGNVDGVLLAPAALLLVGAALVATHRIDLTEDA